jgi:hypothetical protein
MTNLKDGSSCVFAQLKISIRDELEPKIPYFAQPKWDNFKPLFFHHTPDLWQRKISGIKLTIQNVRRLRGYD